MKKTCLEHSRENKEPYLKIPAQILNLSGISLSEKVLLAHIYSFGAKGCWQSNETLAEIFMVAPRSIKRWLSSIRKFLIIKNGKGYYRTIWANTTHNAYMVKNGPDVGQNWHSDQAKNAFRVGQKCPTTNNNTITENNKRTIASPAPLPACGQASATLIARKEDVAAEIERFKFKRTFDRAKQQWQPLSEEKLQQRKSAQLAALRAINP
jgi:hypothetical protein